MHIVYSKSWHIVYLQSMDIAYLFARLADYYSDGSSPEQELHAVCETFPKIIVALPKTGTSSSPKGVLVPMCSVTLGLDNSHVISWQQIESL